MARLLEDPKVKLAIWLLSLVFLAGGAYYQLSELKAAVHDIAIDTYSTKIEVRELKAVLQVRVESAEKDHDIYDRRLERLEEKLERRPK